MSYSFSMSAPTKEDAIRQIEEKFAGVVESQPSHAADKEAAVTAAQALVGIVSDPPESSEILVAMHGSLSWNFVPEMITAASVSIVISLRAKTT